MAAKIKVHIRRRVNPKQKASQGITQVVQPQPESDYSHGETIPYILFDTFLLLPGHEMGNVYLFNVPIGIEKKTDVDTNMLCACRLPMPQTFQLASISLDFLNAPEGEDVQRFLRSFSFELCIGSKLYIEALASDLRPPDRIYQRHTIGNGFDFWVRFKERHPFLLNPYGKGIRGRVQLHGLLTRPIQ